MTRSEAHGSHGAGGRFPGAQGRLPGAPGPGTGTGSTGSAGTARDRRGAVLG